MSNKQEEISFYDMRTWKIVKQIKHKEVINALKWDQGDGNLFFVTDEKGQVCIFNGSTSLGQSLYTIEKCHNPPGYTMAVDTRNRYFATGGNDSQIGIWDMNSLMLIKTISNNDARAMAVSLNHDGSLIAAICEDDINKRYLLEVYDFNYDDPLMCG